MADSYSRLANSTRQVTILKILFVILSVLFVALIITLTVVLTSKRAKDSSNDRGLKFCPENTELTVSTARSSGLYDDLSEKEIISEGFYTQPNVSEYNSLQRCKHQR